MNILDKQQLAADFINKIRTMKPDDLNKFILDEAGSSLPNFFLQYAINLIQSQPQRVVENTSALMLMGYLIRVNEEKINKDDNNQLFNIFQKAVA